MNNLSKNLRFLRRRNGLSQQELAARIGVLRSTLAAYESKNVEPRLDTLVQIALIFGIDLHELILADQEERQHAKAVQNSGTASKQELINKFNRLQSLLENQKQMMEMKWKESAQISTELQRAVAEMDNFVLLTDQFSHLSKELLNGLTD